MTSLKAIRDIILNKTTVISVSLVQQRQHQLGMKLILLELMFRIKKNNFQSYFKILAVFEQESIFRRSV